MPSSSHSRGALALAAAFTSVPAFAQPSPEAETVVVTASRTAQRMRDAIPHTTILTRKDIRDSQAIDLPSLLRREAGFEYSQSGGIGALTGIFMRGGRSAQTLFLVDGVRIEDASSGQSAIQHLLLDDVERIEVVRGNVSALYGSGAIGGVVQVFTRRGRGTPAPSAEVTLGERGTSKISASYGGQTGDTRFNLGVSRFGTRGFSSIDTRLAPAANSDPDGYTNDSVTASITRRFSARHEGGLSWYRARGRIDYDNAFGVPTQTNKSAQDVETLSGYWEARFVDAWKSRITLAQGSDYRTDTRNELFFSRANTRNRQFIWDNELEVAPEHRLSAGVEVLRQSLVASTLVNPVYSRNADTLRVGYLGRFGGHSLQLNARREDYSDFGSASTRYAGYGYDLSDAWRITASASTAFRAPSFVDLFGFGGNPALRPERARTKEIGLQRAAGSHVLRVVAFDTRYQDAITFDVAVFQVRNVRKASVHGTEASYSGRLAGFDLRASLTVQDPVEQEPSAPELQAVRRAKVFGSLAAYRSFGSWRFGGELLSSGERPDTHIVSGARLQTAGYAVVNLSARYQIDRSWYAAGRLDNAFNEKYQLVHGYNTAPRGVFLTLGWQNL